MTNVIRIKDTGLDKVGGTVTYTQIDSGNWIDLSGFVMRFEFTVLATTHQATQVDGDKLTFFPNEVTGVQAPRITLQGLIDATNATTISNIIQLNRTMGVKRLSGGIGVISGMPEKLTDTYDYISVIIKNITMSEVLSNDKEFANITIQLEQVR